MTIDLAPIDAAAFDADAARHLLRRAGFGQAPAEVDAALARGLEATVDALLQPDDDSGIEALDRSVDLLAGDLENVQAWLIARMVRSRSPLREKLALFWHGHFATSNDKVLAPELMLRQARTFLALGAGRFADLLRAVAADPAMLIWLDGERNQRGKPNENFARELFELFTLGLGRYGERDVQEAARAFTGWRRTGDGFEFLAGRHDDGAKTVLGRTGTLGADDVLALCVEHPATARRLSARLLRFFASPDPAPEAVDAFAAELRARDLDVGASMRTLLRSRFFFAREHRAARIASPVELVVGQLSTLGARAAGKAVAKTLAVLGQNLLRPPTVKGWDGEAAWIHAGAVLERMNAAAAIAKGGSGGLATRLDAPAILALADRPDRAALAKLCELLLPARPPAAEIDRLAGELRGSAPEATLAVVLALPEASLC